MPSRHSNSPPSEPPSSSDRPEAMLLTEMASVIPSPYLLHPPLPHVPNPSSQSNLQHTTFSSPLMVLPPLQIHQPGSFRHNFSHHDPALILPPGHYHSRPSLAPFDNAFSKSPSSPSFSSMNSTPSCNMTDPEREMRRHDAPQESMHFGATPSVGISAPSRPASFSPARLSSTLRRGSLHASQHRRMSRRASAEARGSSVGINGLVGTYDPRCSLEYKMIIRQQPLAARACGFGERDRRVIDPPPILQMTVQNPTGTGEDLSPELRYPHSVVHCELWNADADMQETAIPELGERRQQRRLVGTVVASPFYGRDESGAIGCFFPFPDLSCRTIGRYRLRFVLMLANPAGMRLGDSLPFRDVAISSVFHVFTAKTFPGMVPSSQLTRRLKEQGCLISVKKGHQRGDQAQNSPNKDEMNEDGEGEDEEDEERSDQGAEKRQKA